MLPRLDASLTNPPPTRTTSQNTAYISQLTAHSPPLPSRFLIHDSGARHLDKLKCAFLEPYSLKAVPVEAETDLPGAPCKQSSLRKEGWTLFSHWQLLATGTGRVASRNPNVNDRV